MSALPSLDEFVAWEETQELRYEYDGSAIYEMKGATYAHARIQSNLISSFGARLVGRTCVVLGGLLKVRTPTSIRYPDSLVHCSYIPPNSTFAPAPVVIFEVLSPSSAARDLGAKTAEYLSLPSLRRYVVLHQCAAAANVFFRSDDGDWRHEFLAAEDALALPEIGVEVALAEIYDGIEF